MQGGILAGKVAIVTGAARGIGAAIAAAYSAAGARLAALDLDRRAVEDMIAAALGGHVAEVLIFVPSVANMRLRWLEDRLNTAAAAERITGPANSPRNPNA